MLLTAAPQRVALITDAMAAAAHADGDYRLGDLDVRVVEGRALLDDGVTIAGSTLNSIARSARPSSTWDSAVRCRGRGDGRSRRRVGRDDPRAPRTRNARRPRRVDRRLAAAASVAQRFVTRRSSSFFATSMKLGAYLAHS